MSWSSTAPESREAVVLELLWFIVRDQRQMKIFDFYWTLHENRKPVCRGSSSSSALSCTVCRIPTSSFVLLSLEVRRTWRSPPSVVHHQGPPFVAHHRLTLNWILLEAEHCIICIFYTGFSEDSPSEPDLEAQVRDLDITFLFWSELNVVLRRIKQQGDAATCARPHQVAKGSWLVS